ncbi:class A beta-lactamase [Naumannella huperziae]
MEPNETSPVRSTQIARRTVLAGAAAAAAAAAVGGAGAPAAVAAGSPIAELEGRYDRRIGLYAENLRTGRRIAHRPDERFAMCSTFKPFAVAAALDGRLVSPDPKFLQRRAYYPPSLVPDGLWAPRTREWLERGYAPTMAEICEACTRESDNGAANLLQQYIGGPGAVTRLYRDLGDRVSVLERWEPEMSDWDPSSIRDTSTPRAMGNNYRELLLGRTLRRRIRDQLTEWLLGNLTSDNTFRKELPADWRLADKTGSGGDYATRNNIGIAWTGTGVPIVISAMTSSSDIDAETLDAPLVDIMRLVVRELG